MAKVFYNIDESTYCCGYGRFIFYFTRLPYLEKFIEEINPLIENEKYKLSARFNIDCDLDELLMFYLYSKIEKNGCKIETSEGVIRCLKDIKLSGVIVMKENSKEL